MTVIVNSPVLTLLCCDHDTHRDFAGRLAFKLAPRDLQDEMREYIQTHQHVWPYKVCGVIPGVSAAKDKGSAASAAVKRKPSSKRGKGKGGGKAPVAAAATVDAGDDASDDDALLSAAVSQVSAAKAQAVDKVKAMKAQQALSHRVSDVAGRLSMGQAALVELLQCQHASDASFSLAEALDNLEIALDAGLSVEELLSSLQSSHTPQHPIAAAAPTHATAAVLCGECGEQPVAATSAQPVCANALCVRKYRAKLAAEAASRRK